MTQGNYSRFIPLICRRPKTDQRSEFSEIAARIRAERNAERGESEPESERPPREHDASEASEASGASEANDFVERFLLAGARRRGEVPLAPPPPQPTPVAMTAEAIINAGKKRRGESAGGLN
jgi:hypothetical protein